MSKANNRLRMAQLVVDFTSIGVHSFPRDYITKYCPYKQGDKKYKWFTSAANVWNLRNTDEKIIKVFEKAFQDAQNEFEPSI